MKIKLELTHAVKSLLESRWSATGLSQIFVINRVKIETSNKKNDITKYSNLRKLHEHVKK